MQQQWQRDVPNAHRAAGPPWGLLGSSLKDKQRNLSESWQRKSQSALWRSKLHRRCLITYLMYVTLCTWLRRRRPRKVKWLTQNNTDGLWQSWLLNTGLLILNAVFYLLFECTASLMSVCQDISRYNQKNSHNYCIEAWNPLNSGNNRQKHNHKLCELTVLSPCRAEHIVLVKSRLWSQML